ncbi:metallophosphoesterase [Myxococcus sp. K15C18031901]|uniref:metallophosphoesterase n=1 Tax=Myxococcus dinghuensis TaxID=2906761 RepID=UPI0020A7346E|nr:metallophosphoesterase [Myxococcus dinghuensis]MCP3104356.1 metallophosphoesterase [Myxococcus dinghuensis]
MVRPLLLSLLYVATWGILRSLWPGLLQGWRRWVLGPLAVVSVGVWLYPLMVGRQADVPSVLRIGSVGMTIAAVIVVLVGGPLVLLRRWLERRSRAAAPRAPAPAPELAVEVPPSPLAGGAISRRNLLTHMGRAVPVLAAGTSTAGLANGSSGFQVKEVEVRLPNLPPALDGFRIGQITDVHVGNFIETRDLRAAVAAMNAAKVDLQVMTGDLIDDLDQLDDTMAALAECQAPHGMTAVLGNHEHWRGLDEVLGAYAALEAKGAPVRLLVDGSHVLEHAGQRVRVVGVDYPMSGRSHRVKAERMQRSAEVAFRDVGRDEVVLCLSHHPDFFDLAAERGARLTLSGHTHGGQVAVLGMPAFWFAFKYMLGRYRNGDHQLYVSGGTGHWMPFRLGVPAEVTVLTLRAA